ncbi:fibrobacter succinogenes major paralogous domain-containing protein [candidate division KSB1 bacterium]
MRKKLVQLIYTILISGVLFLFSNSCKKDEAKIPELTTNPVSNISATIGICGGNISSDGGASITARGVCWSTSQTPTISDTKTNDGTGTGSFISNMVGLIPDTTNYIRAYATNSKGTAYGNVISVKTLAGESFIDPRDGNVYNAVQIGTKVWMSENLRYLPTVHNNTQFETQGHTNLQPGYGVYGYDGNDVASAKALAKYKTYGVLYNWFAVSTANICPNGWHVATDNEWKSLTNYLGGESIAGGKLKATGTTHWKSPNTGATNETGFTALPGGRRHGNGLFFDSGSMGRWWTADEEDIDNAWFRSMKYDDSEAFRGWNYKKYGYSVRCVKD